MTTSSPILSFLIEGVGGMELAFILFLVLILFGGQKLPEFAKGLGKSMREFKRAASDVEQEIKRAIDAAPDSDSAPKSAALTSPTNPTPPTPPPRENPTDPAPPAAGS